MGKTQSQVDNTDIKQNFEIEGTVEKILFQSSDNNFTVFIIQDKNKNLITVSGYVNIQAGQEVRLKGQWVMHPKFGKQFQANECINNLPTNIIGLKKYLGSGLIKGIGPTYAGKLVNYFGKEILNILDTNPERLLEVAGIGTKKLDLIKNAWTTQKEISNIMIFLQEKNISCALAAKIYKKYKNESINVLNENPYRLADEVWGIGFKTADEIALKIGFSLESENRISAGILYAITVSTKQGHLYTEIQHLKDTAIELLTLDKEQHGSLIKQALHSLYNKDKIKLISYNQQHYITLTQYYLTEKNISDKIKTVLSIPSKFNFNIDQIYNKLRAPKTGEIDLNEDQQRGIISALQNKITIITGGPGTGKTTLIKKLLQILESEKVNYKLSAPTGRAAKRIIEGTGKHAMTIHRLLEFDVATFGFTHNETNALKTDFLIIDEASMIDVFLFNSILKALSINSHLILIGDVDQLPSVGPGNILNDLIESSVVPFVRLTQIFRQAQDSLIVVNAHKINKGQYPVSYLENSKNDFIFIKEDNPEEVKNHLKKILFITLKKYNISISDSIVLSPMNRGNIGTYSLNHVLQELLNSDSTTYVNHSINKFKINDKVMQIRNNYDKKVYNGDIGTIDDINLEDKQLKVDYGDNIVIYEFDELDELVLAYAISIHKSQGSEYKAVIIPIFTQHYVMLEKNLIYTALTRAKTLCIFIGQPKALAMAINNNKKTVRLTFLKEFLTDSQINTI